MAAQDLSFAFGRIGNLIRRTDHLASNDVMHSSLTETFKYDELNRLKKEIVDYEVPAADTYTYDSSGNLLKKDNQTLSYAKTGNAGPHAVTSSTNGNSYLYDVMGNVTSRKKNNILDASFAYTSFDKPHSITSNGWTSKISYDANRNRYIRKDINASTKVTHYLGSVEIIYENGDVKAKRYIGNLVINIDNISEDINLWDYNYLLKDHIGSTHTIVDQAGIKNTKMSFNAWGQRRKAPTHDEIQNLLLIPINSVWIQLGQSIEDTTNRGFTGHEHFDQVGIIHMNGRIYDPTIGRFLQADPIVQDPYNTQSLNRYSYVMNNPLSYTDPTGYSRLRKGAWRQIAAIAITIYTAGAASAAMAASSAASAISGAAASIGFSGMSTAFAGVAATLQTQAFLISVAGGALAGGVSAGSLKGAVKGGIIAAVTFGIGHGAQGGASPFSDPQRIFAHSLVSGVSAEVDGGKFGHGFASALLSQNIGSKKFFQKGDTGGRIVSNAILQGTISEATGGKFANGAMSAAFRVAFNDSLKFNGKKLTHLDDDGKVVGTYEALSGRRGSRIDKADGQFVKVDYDYTSSEHQGLKDNGPIPEGEYIVKQSEYQSIENISTKDRIKGALGGGPWPGNERSWGSHRIWIYPSSGTKTFGRDGFSIHGGAVFGSAGCIDLCSNMDSFIKAFRANGDDMKLNVKYD